MTTKQITADNADNHLKQLYVRGHFRMKSYLGMNNDKLLNSNFYDQTDCE